MSDILSLFGGLNPFGENIIGDSALNLTANIIDNYDLSAYKPSEILSALHDSGIGISVPDFYDVYNTITGSKVRSQRIIFVNADKTPTEAILEPSRYKLPTRYRIIHVITYTDNETGAVITREYLTDTNVLSTIDDMQQDARDRFEAKYDVTIEDIKTVRGYITPGL